MQNRRLGWLVASVIAGIGCRSRAARPRLGAGLALVALVGSGCCARGATPQHPSGPVKWYPVPESAIACYLSGVDPEPRDGDPVRLRMELENRSRQAIAFARSATPFEVISFADAYLIRAPDGSTLQYTGLIASRSRTAWEVIPGGARRGATVDLAALYAFKGPGAYRVTYQRAIEVQPAYSLPPEQAPRHVVPLNCPEIQITIMPRA